MFLKLQLLTEDPRQRCSMHEASVMHKVAAMKMPIPMTPMASRRTLSQVIPTKLQIRLTTMLANMLLCGLYFGKGHPKMAPFLDLFIENINKVGAIKWECNGFKLSSKCCSRKPEQSREVAPLPPSCADSVQPPPRATATRGGPEIARSQGAALRKCEGDRTLCEQSPEQIIDYLPTDGVV
ncbi:hypothetical protein HPB50_002165 [Hyalomma asiaticum]|uniref:Uncharacterized protein n=1 Tax=Hyalomma asiaticum TaxID=266040 RepID=A0ACB7RM30_HYAAI|nr:hypothetical protein HPB50_002165 [Hyalomma asiaticum]